MPDSMQYQQCRQLKDEAKQCAENHKYMEAAQLYEQAYELCRDSYAASRYLYCLRKSGVTAARKAAKIARQIALIFPDNSYVNREYVWAIYDGYLKGVDIDDSEDEEDLDDTEHEGMELPSHDFRMKVNAARRIFELTMEPWPRNLTVFAICKEAKRLKKWEIVREFAQRLDPQTLSMEQKELDGRRLPSDYQKWLFAIIRSLLELGCYDECMVYAHEAIEKFPDESLHFQRWEALAKIRLGMVEEGLKQLEYIDLRFPKQWYIQSDIASACVKLERYDDAWLWFCKAASAQGDIKGRIAVLIAMSDLLQRLERWQIAYQHLQLIWAIEVDQHNRQRAARTYQRILEFRKHHVDHLSQAKENGDDEAASISAALKPCRLNWQKTINTSRPVQHGRISFLDAEKQYGFIINDSGRFRFRFNAFIKGKPEADMYVAFAVEEAFDQKHNRKSDIAVNVHPAKNSAQSLE